MPDQNISEDILLDPNNTITRLFDLVLGKVLKRVYLDISDSERKEMEKVFLSDDDKLKEKFVKKYIPNFKELFEEESKKIEEEIKFEMQTQN